MVMKTMIFISLSFCTLLFANAQEFAVKQLESSPRHQEWVKVPSGEREVNCFVVYPEIPEKTTVVIVIHENRGLTDWVRSFADQLAGEGYITIAPDMLSDFEAEIKSTADFPTPDKARNAIYQLDPKQIEKDLNAVQTFAANLDAGNGKTVVAGFCWGGSQSFRFATYNNKIEAALVFYGSAPKSEKEIKKIKVPVYGFYGGNDARINIGIEKTEELMRKVNKTYNYKIYEGAGHGYMRQGDDPEGSEPNKKARDESWERIINILEEL